jgi:hypothetical protein
LPNISFNFSLGTLSVLPGTVGLTQITLNSLNSYSGTVTFACSGLPIGSFCTFNPNPVSLIVGQSAVSTLSVYTSASAAAVHHDSRPIFPAAALAAALCFLGFKKRNRLQLLVLVIICMSGLGLLSGCGGANSTPTPIATTATITVTATAPTVASGTLTTSSTFNLIVQ